LEVEDTQLFQQFEVIFSLQKLENNPTKDQSKQQNHLQGRYGF
jgi:hypothetical protein